MHPELSDSSQFALFKLIQPVPERTYPLSQEAQVFPGLVHVLHDDGHLLQNALLLNGNKK